MLRFISSEFFIFKDDFFTKNEIRLMKLLLIEKKRSEAFSESHPSSKMDLKKFTRLSY